MIKKFIFCCLLFVVSCRKTDIRPVDEPQQIKDIFQVKEITVSDGQELRFNLNKDGIYMLTLFDSVGQQVLTREKFVGKIGQNSINLYTKSLPVRYLYLSLEDQNGALIGKTMVAAN